MTARVGMAEAAGTGSAVLVEGLRGALDSGDGLLAARAIRRVRGLTDPAVTVLLTIAMRHEDSYVRKTAVEVAKPLDARNVVDAKIGCLSDEEANVRESAVLSLEGHQGREVRAALLGALADPFWTVRKGAVEALGTDESGEVTAALRAALYEDEDGEVRRSALSVLWGRFGVEERVESARRCLKDRDSSVRLEAVRLIENVGQAAAAALLEPLLHDASAVVRNTAARALMRGAGEARS